MEIAGGRCDEDGTDSAIWCAGGESDGDRCSSICLPFRVAQSDENRRGHALFSAGGECDEDRRVWGLRASVFNGMRLSVPLAQGWRRGDAFLRGSVCQGQRMWMA